MSARYNQILEIPIVLLTTIEQLSTIIHKTPQSIRCDLKRRPESLPPRIQIPGSRKVLFMNVDQWLSSLQILNAPQIKELNQPSISKRGRPTKVEQMTRAPRVADASVTRGINKQ